MTGRSRRRRIDRQSAPVVIGRSILPAGRRPMLREPKGRSSRRGSRPAPESCEARGIVPSPGMTMTMLALPFPEFNPVAIELGPFAVKWYGLAYMTGLVLGWLYIRRLVDQPQLWALGQPPFPVNRTDDLLLYMTAGVVLGGRLGFVLFYEPGHFLANPSEIPMVWKGGMAFH